MDTTYLREDERKIWDDMEYLREKYGYDEPRYAHTRMLMSRLVHARKNAEILRRMGDGWVSVEEPPKEYGDYQVFTAGGLQDVAEYFPVEDNLGPAGKFGPGFYTMDSRDLQRHEIVVTHWMPLPPAPAAAMAAAFATPPKEDK